jgi:NAD(P)-dependent dehydrogenase (short-subunit alcohol dehydrogenase family)
MFASYPSLAGRTVLVTGGASGIGAWIVAAFCAQGARVACLDIRDGGDELAEALGDTANRPLALRCDLTDLAALEAAIGRVRAELGPVGVLVNNAANDQRQAIDAVTPESWQQGIDVNLRHVFFASQLVLPQMRALGQGAIVNLTSIAWMGGAPNLSVYVAAKAAIEGLTRSMANELGPTDRIRVNAIAPGAVMTERQRQLWYKTDEQVQAMVGRQALREVLHPAEIARAALFLAADDSRMITKQTLVVDGGLR